MGDPPGQSPIRVDILWESVVSLRAWVECVRGTEHVEGKIVLGLGRRSQTFPIDSRSWLSRKSNLFLRK